jgi:hypothetical protein
VSELDIRAALEIGDFGFVHSFTTGSAVDGPGMRVVAWLGLSVSLRLLPQSRHLENDQRHTGTFGARGGAD